MNYVYLIRCNDNHFQTKYKIGIAQDVQTRLAQLQTGSPYVLEVMECYGYENAEVVERALHQAFKSQRIQGEWFILNNEQATEDFSKICIMLGGQVGILQDDKSTPRDVFEAESIDDALESARLEYRTELRMRNGEPRGIVLIERNVNRNVIGYINHDHEDFEKYLEIYKQEHPDSKVLKNA